MKIAITVPSLTSINTHQDGQNIQGDEMIARSWAKYLKLEHNLEVALFNGHEGEQNGFDHVIHFSILYNGWSNTNNILYFQNVFPPESWPGGTIGQFNLHKHKYNNFIFTSHTLQEHCNVDGLVIPFAVDPDIYKPTFGEGYNHTISFVGNSIRGPAINAKYIEPALSRDLVIYGSGVGWPSHYSPHLKGKISQIPDESILYTQSKINLNCHINEHIIHDTINYRIYCILACNGIIITDVTPSLEKHFAEYVTFTSGDNNLIETIDDILINFDKYKTKSELGKKYVLESHTFSHRMNDLIVYLKTIIER